MSTALLTAPLWCVECRLEVAGNTVTVERTSSSRRRSSGGGSSSSMRRSRGNSSSSSDGRNSRSSGSISKIAVKCVWAVPVQSGRGCRLFRPLLQWCVSVPAASVRILRQKGHDRCHPLLPQHCSYTNLPLDAIPYEPRSDRVVAQAVSCRFPTA